MHIKIEEEFDPALLEIAKHQGFLWGEKPNVTALIKAIALREIKLIPNPKANFSQLSNLKNLIENKQAFKLLYTDAGGEPFVFSCLWAQMIKHEDTPYLDIWVKEELESDCEQLKHNRCLRLDRIVDYNLYSLEDSWREKGLDTIEVTFELFGNLALSFSREKDDIVEQIGKKSLITRKINNIFWFKRKIIKYAGNLKIVSPSFLIDWYVDFLEEALSIQKKV